MALYIGIKNLIGKGAAWLRSKWTTIVTQLLAEFRYRLAGGSDNSSLPERKGRAVFKKVYGNTVKWNQLVQNGDFSDGTTGYNTYACNINVENSILLATVTSTSAYCQVFRNLNGTLGHVYYASVLIEEPRSTTVRLALGNGNNLSNILYQSNVVGLKKCSGIATAQYNITELRFYINSSNTLQVDDVVKIHNIQIIDLTALEYPNIATVTPTVEEVEAWLALNVGAQDYYPYDEGSLVSFKGSALQVKKDGAVIDEVDLSGAYINVWDEIPAYGTFSGSDGETFNPNSGFLASQNKIKVMGGETYYFKINQSFRVFYYDASGTFISSTLITAAETSITLDSNVGYIRFQRGITGTYNHDICINVSNADINGTYFPHALQSAGSVTDEDTATELTKRVGVVDLGVLNWSYISSAAWSCFSANVTGKKPGYNLICSKYARGLIYNTNNDKVCYGNSANNILYIRDTSYGTDASSFKTAMSGALLYFELATPITIPHDTPMQYAVDKYCTEEVVVPTSADGAPTSTNIVADIEYQAK